MNWFKRNKKESAPDAFKVLVHKEMADHIKSWRFIILVALIALTCLGSMYTALANIAEAIKTSKADDVFVFLKLYTVSDGTLPSFFVFVGFLGPLLGIGMGFDAVNSEMNKGTVSRILSQPIPRDYFINAKFTASLGIISLLFFTLSFLVMGIGLLAIGIPPTPEEFMRIVLFTLAAIVYVAFWLNLSILFSIKFVQPATSALTGISVWLFFSIFYNMLVGVVFKMLVPAGRNLSVAGERMKLNISQLAPNQLFNEITNVLLTPTVRSVGPLTMEQVRGAIPGPIPVWQSMMLVWPQIIGIIALTVICFVISYLLFVKREIRST
ncbi:MULTISPECIES: ABC transporter permease [unclassified Saccharicrinis]|uniref:ABC transporter permease n=1 Tax=unclassified Saccharicrinis TaxID=2646859 RepID=UPI003D336D50